jgi:D-glycero-D-manno-heptose 1,7-bisphosphate phosphatase
MPPLIALDRDGTLIEELPYLSNPERVRLLPSSAAALRALSLAGCEVAVLTNQSGVGRGFFGIDAVSAVNERMRALLAAEGAAIGNVFVCPHPPQAGCPCRKPGTLMLDLAAAGRAGAASGPRFVVGDKPGDIEMGRRAGATTILVRTGWGRRTEADPAVDPDYIADDLLEAARLIIDITGGRPNAR